MSLWQRSLFSRLTLVLLGGLLVAQLLSFAIHMHDRSELLVQASGMQSAQRIADIVRLLDTMTPAERSRIVRVLSAPPLTVALDRGPLAVQDAASDQFFIHERKQFQQRTAFDALQLRFVPHGPAVGRAALLGRCTRKP